MESVTFISDKKTIQFLIELVNHFKNDNIIIDTSVKKTSKRKQQLGILSDYPVDPNFYEPLDKDELDKW